MIEEENVALAHAGALVSQDPIRGADQSRPEYAQRLVAEWRKNLQPAEKVPQRQRRLEREDVAVMQQWRNVSKETLIVAMHYRTVEKIELTGNLTEGDLISAAVGTYCGAGVNEAIREDREEDKQNGEEAQALVQDGQLRVCGDLAQPVAHRQIQWGGGRLGAVGQETEQSQTS